MRFFNVSNLPLLSKKDVSACPTKQETTDQNLCGKIPGHTSGPENLPGVNKYLQRENTWTSNYADCTGSLAENRSCHWQTSCSSTKKS